MRIGIAGTGVVSPAGWGVAPFLRALESAASLPVEERGRPGRERWPSRIRAVPKPGERLPFLRHPRMRRTSPIGRFLVGAALEALGDERAERVRAGDLRLGVVTTLYCGCVNYSRRFYGEVLEDPRTASPIVFPETVFNAPSGHLSAMLGSHAANYTMVGDSAEFLCGLDLAVGWMLDDNVDACLLVCGEEFDWLTAEAMALYEPGCVMAEGGAALYLEKSEQPEVELLQIAGPELITSRQPRAEAARLVREAIVGGSESDWIDPQMTRQIFGEGLGVSAGWQCVAAVERARRDAGRTAVAISGINEHCAAAVFGG